MLLPKKVAELLGKNIEAQHKNAGVQDKNKSARF